MKYNFSIKKLERNIIICNDILHSSGFQSLRCENFQSSDRWRINKIYQNDFDFLMIIVLLFHCVDEI